MGDRPTLGADFDKPVVEQFTEFRKAHGLNKSEALRHLVTVGLRDAGYLTEPNSGAIVAEPTRLQRVATEVWRALAWAAIALIVADGAGAAVDLTVAGALLLTVALGAVLVERVEPSVTRRVWRRQGAVADGGQPDE